MITAYNANLHARGLAKQVERVNRTADPLVKELKAIIQLQRAEIDRLKAQLQRDTTRSLTVRELAKRSGVSQSTISRALRGESRHHVSGNNVQLDSGRWLLDPLAEFVRGK